MGTDAASLLEEGRVFVVGVTVFICGCDVATDLPGAAALYDDGDAPLSNGNSSIVAPGGEVLEGPLIGASGTVTATLDLDQIAAGRRVFDPVGHYARPEILTLTSNTNGDNHE